MTLAKHVVTCKSICVQSRVLVSSRSTEYSSMDYLGEAAAVLEWYPKHLSVPDYLWTPVRCVAGEVSTLPPPLHTCEISISPYEKPIVALHSSTQHRHRTHIVAGGLGTSQPRISHVSWQTSRAMGLRHHPLDLQSYVIIVPHNQTLTL